MKGPTWTWIVALCVFTEILLLTTAQVEHMRNVAINKTCNTSSQYNEANKYSGNCSAAINGILDTNFQIDRSPPNCIHTSSSDIRPFWWVDLGQNISVHGVTIYGLDYHLHRMQYVQVSLDGRGIYTFPPSGIESVTYIFLHPPQQGRVVNITRKGTSLSDRVPFLNICEVQIWGCKNGLWGDDCQYECSRWCQGSEEDNYCDSDNGTCLKGCLLGYWGGNCTFTCGAGCNSSACNTSDGTCQCRPGWESPLCQNCSKGRYNVSNDCQNTCGRGCNDTCSTTDGTCRCQQGWQPPLCRHCTVGYCNVSTDCQNTCGEGCNNACNRTNGTCQCHPGWQPPLCQQKMPLYGDKETVGLAGPVAGAAVGCSIVFLITGILIGLCLRRSRSKQNSKTLSSPNETSMTCDTAEQPGTTSVKDTSDHSNNIYDALDPCGENIAPYTSLCIQTNSNET